MATGEFEAYRETFEELRKELKRLLRHVACAWIDNRPNERVAPGRLDAGNPRLRRKSLQAITVADFRVDAQDRLIPESFRAIHHPYSEVNFEAWLRLDREVFCEVETERQLSEIAQELGRGLTEFKPERGQAKVVVTLAKSHYG